MLEGKLMVQLGVWRYFQRSLMLWVIVCISCSRRWHLTNHSLNRNDHHIWLGHSNRFGHFQGDCAWCARCNGWSIVRVGDVTWRRNRLQTCHEVFAGGTDVTIFIESRPKHPSVAGPRHYDDGRGISIHLEGCKSKSSEIQSPWNTPSKGGTRKALTSSLLCASWIHVV